MDNPKKASGAFARSEPETSIKLVRCKCNQKIIKIDMLTQILMSHVITIEQINVNFDINAAVIIGKFLNFGVVVMEHVYNNLGFSGTNPNKQNIFHRKDTFL